MGRACTIVYMGFAVKRLRLYVLIALALAFSSHTLGAEKPACVAAPIKRTLVDTLDRAVARSTARLSDLPLEAVRERCLLAVKERHARVARNPRNFELPADIDLPELKGDARLLLAQVLILQEEAKAVFDDAFVRDAILVRDEWPDTEEWIRADIATLHRDLGILRSELQKMLRSSTLSYQKWYRLTKQFAALASAVRSPVGYNWLRHQLRTAPWRSSEMHGYVDLITERRAEGWIKLPIAKEVSIDEFNEWMSFGITPISVSDRYA